MREMGRRGGIKGGRARAESLSPARRKSIARLGAAKTNEAVAALTDEERARAIMEKRRATARRLGMQSAIDGLPQSRNPYAARAFTAQLRDQWAAGWKAGRRALRRRKGTA